MWPEGRQPLLSRDWLRNARAHIRVDERDAFHRRDYVVALTQADDMQTVVSQLEDLWASGDCRSDTDWSRDELHERP